MAPTIVEEKGVGPTTYDLRLTTYDFTPEVWFSVTIHIKRAYDPPTRTDGTRILVDRLWPRGLKKEALELDGWMKEIAPSPGLRTWFGHKPERFAEFRTRYRTELDQHRDEVRELRSASRKGTLTLVYGARDTEHNGALVLREYLEGS